MKLRILFLLLMPCLFACEEVIFGKDPTFNITNSSSGIIKQVDVKLQINGKPKDAISLSNLDINKTETKYLQLSAFDVKGDAGYIVLVILSDGTKLEKTFGYVDNGSDTAKKPYDIVISNSEITIK